MRMWRGWRARASSDRRTRLLLIHQTRECPSKPIDCPLHEQLRRLGTQLESIERVSIEPASVAAIDMRSIAQLAENDELGDQFVTEIIDVFLGDLSKRVDAIGLLMSQGDGAGIAGSAHAIKGSCGHFGAARLMELSREVENLGRRGQTDGLQDAIDAMVTETQRVCTALEAYRSSHTPQ